MGAENLRGPGKIEREEEKVRRWLRTYVGRRVVRLLVSLLLCLECDGSCNRGKNL
jgi:hypothetical protein